jgi:hypothetical protein
MRFVGNRSYAFYLSHWPALIIASDYAGHKIACSSDVAVARRCISALGHRVRAYENPDPARAVECAGKRDVVAVFCRGCGPRLGVHPRRDQRHVVSTASERGCGAHTLGPSRRIDEVCAFWGQSRSCGRRSRPATSSRRRSKGYAAMSRNTIGTHPRPSRGLRNTRTSTSFPEVAPRVVARAPARSVASATPPVQSRLW